MNGYRFIVSDPDILGGTLVVVGTRVPVARLLFLLKDGYTVDGIQEDYPHVDKTKIEGAIDELIRGLGKRNATAFLQI